MNCAENYLSQVGDLKGIFDLPYCPNKHYQGLKYRPSMFLKWYPLEAKTAPKN